jgi:hypothetical protein
MGTDEVIRKTLALAQSQLSNYKAMDSRRAASAATQESNTKGTTQTAPTRTVKARSSQMR